MSASKLLTPKDLADAIGASESSLRRWVDSGRVKMSRTAGGHRRIPLAEAIRFIRETHATVVRPDLLGLGDVASLRWSSSKAAAASAGADRDNVYSGVRAEQRAIAAQAVETAQANLLLAQQENTRVVKLAAQSFASRQTLDDSTAEGRAAIFDLLTDMQGTFTKLEALRLPVIAAIQGGCVGGAVDQARDADESHSVARPMVFSQRPVRKYSALKAAPAAASGT